MGYKTQVKQLADFHDAYGLETGEEDGEEEDDDDEDVDDGDEDDSGASTGSYESDEDE
jgi:hypothetical protein